MMQSSLEKHINNLETILELEGEEGQFEYLIDIGKKNNCQSKAIWWQYAHERFK